MATAQENRMHTSKYCVPTSQVSHPLKDTDFSRIQPCICTTNCKHHYTFEEPTTLPTAPSNHTDKALQDDLDILDQELDITPTINKIQKIQILRGQNDIGANTSVTNDKDALLLYQDITALPIGGVNKDDPAISCTGKGYLRWTAQNGNSLLVPTYYCEQADGTIISPHSIQSLYKKTFSGFHLFCDCNSKTGHLKFYHRDGINHSVFEAYSNNNLWFHNMSPADSNTYIHPTVNRLSSIAKYELWHQRLIHPGERCMKCIHHHVDGINDQLTGNTFYRCASCMQGKPRKSPSRPQTSLKHKGKKYRTRKHRPSIEVEDDTNAIDDILIPNAKPGQHFHMDFGFVRGSSYTIKQEDGPPITSKEGYNSYLLIIDRATRYMWVFLTSSKEPPTGPL